MNQDQLRADKGEVRPSNQPPDDQRSSSKPLHLRHSSGRERRHRDFGMARDTDVWAAHKRREVD